MAVARWGRKQSSSLLPSVDGGRVSEFIISLIIANNCITASSNPRQMGRRCVRKSSCSSKSICQHMDEHICSVAFSDWWQSNGKWLKKRTKINDIQVSHYRDFCTSSRDSGPLNAPSLIVSVGKLVSRGQKCSPRQSAPQTNNVQEGTSIFIRVIQHLPYFVN